MTGSYAGSSSVALRKESVDRNATIHNTKINEHVALRKESVDRNGMEVDGVSYDVWSLSARRAWIEIANTNFVVRGPCVALRKESVDRNGCFGYPGVYSPESLSARRAWIEILSMGLDGRFKLVALRKESVDRNLPHLSMAQVCQVALRKESVDRNTSSRLKPRRFATSLSARRAWIEIAQTNKMFGLQLVALRKESVDRNISATAPHLAIFCRSPQGERG